MKNQMMVLSLGVGALLLATHHAFGENANNCGPRDLIIAELDARWGETRQSIGLSSSGALVEMFAAQDTGTWTFAATDPAGRMCIIATGQNFESLRAKKDNGKSA